MLELRGGSVKGISVYERIQESKRLGYSKQKTAERLQCCWRTVDKYWDMTFDDYQVIEAKVRKESVLGQYDAHVIAWLKRYVFVNFELPTKMVGTPQHHNRNSPI